jgi:hypothetical protein
MGLYKGKIQSIFTGFCPVQMIKEGSTYQGRRYRKKEKKKKLSVKKQSIPSFGLGSLSHKKRRAELPERRNVSKNIKKHSI